MDPCGCKGLRFCSACEASERVRGLDFSKARDGDPRDLSTYARLVFCPRCRAAFPPDAESPPDSQTCHSGPGLALGGLLLLPDFLSPAEESELAAAMDAREWRPSQSGRRKQDFGPKVNFKKRKVNVGAFSGLPRQVDWMLDRMAARAPTELGDFRVVEQCNLDYEEDRGAAIEFHKDDSWLWGERLISVNLLSDCVMSLRSEERRLLVSVPMPRRSLLLLAGDVRHCWDHGILSEHVQGRRIGITLREPEAKFLEGGEYYEPTGRLLLEKSLLRICL